MQTSMKNLVVSLLLLTIRAQQLVGVLDDIGVEDTQQTDLFQQREELLAKYRERIKDYDIFSGETQLTTIDKDTPVCQKYKEIWNQPGNSKAEFDKAFAAGKPWEDPGFPANYSSVSLYGINKEEKKGIQYQYVWKRPNEIEPDRKPKLFGAFDTPHPKGILQGYVGDCWFLATAAAIAEVPERFDLLIDEKNRKSDYNAAGIFRFSLYRMGELISVNIDDRLAVYQKRRGGSYHLLFAKKSETHALWFPLLEKAYAKFHVNYHQLDGGQAQETLRLFTNKPIKWMPHGAKDPQGSWMKLQTISEKNYPALSACCYKTPGLDLGLVRGHQYTVLHSIELHSIEQDSDKTIKLVKMRNPWGLEAYRGPWSDKSKEWTDDFKKQANLTVKNDGSFYMLYEHFLKAFGHINIAITENFGHEQYYKYEQKGGGRRDMQKIYIKNPTAQKFFVTIETDRYFRMAPKNCVKNEWLKFWLRGPVRFNHGGYRSTWGHRYHDTFGDEEYNTVYPAGTYTLYVENAGNYGISTVNYIVQISQEKSDVADRITIDGKQGIETPAQRNKKQHEIK